MESALTPTGHDPAVRRLVDICVREARQAVPGIPIGFCGEQVAEPTALVELLRHEPDYVSCGPAHIEVARYVVGRQRRQDGGTSWA
ncbi:putative PEP-binding protein [Georgenia sp. TF02-10]|uniref:putative PEP-binding protein n=1 Tax=Georgenia sp. TF02-10 TaxID=2917725 RepID=UPI00352F7769